MSVCATLIRVALTCAALAGGALLAAGCTARLAAPPPRSPLAETGSMPASSASPAASATLPSAASPPGASPVAAAGLEAASGRAMALLAEWLGIPERGITVVAVEAVEWPNACLGVTLPGVVCASVVTPGYRALLRDPAGGTHAIHLDAGGARARWAGEATVRGSIEAVDPVARRLTVAVDGRSLQLRLAPGSFLPLPLPMPGAGARVVLAYDPAPASTGLPPVAWLAADPG